MGNLSELVDKRRSELYTWFEEPSGTAQEKKQKRAEKVLNGGSVVIEYHPNLWGNLPPGAEEFNKVLSVYR